MSALEVRYRRLLTWFPAEHRDVHGEEMIGVLLASSRPGQRRPSYAESWNLISGALKIRLRPGTALADRTGWRESLALFSVMMPTLMLASVCLSYLADHWWGVFPLGLNGSLEGLEIWGQILLVPLVLLGLRRWAVVTATIPPLFVLLLAVSVSLRRTDSPAAVAGLIQAFLYIVVGSAVEILALLASPGPRRGLALLGRGAKWAVLACAAVPAAALAPTLWLADAYLSPGDAPDALEQIITAIAAALFVALLLSLWLASSSGKRLAVLFGVIAYPYLLAHLQRQNFHWTASLSVLESVSAVVFAGLVTGAVAVALRKSRAAGRSDDGWV
jgi:hypothetical protein